MATVEHLRPLGSFMEKKNWGHTHMRNHSNNDTNSVSYTIFCEKLSMNLSIVDLDVLTQGLQISYWMDFMYNSPKAAVISLTSAYFQTRFSLQSIVCEYAWIQHSEQTASLAVTFCGWPSLWMVSMFVFLNICSVSSPPCDCVVHWPRLRIHLDAQETFVDGYQVNSVIRV